MFILVTFKLQQKKHDLLFFSNRPRLLLLYICFLMQIFRLPVGFIQQAATNQNFRG